MKKTYEMTLLELVIELEECEKLGHKIRFDELVCALKHRLTKLDEIIQRKNESIKPFSKY